MNFFHAPLLLILLTWTFVKLCSSFNVIDVRGIRAEDAKCDKRSRQGQLLTKGCPAMYLFTNIILDGDEGSQMKFLRSLHSFSSFNKVIERIIGKSYRELYTLHKNVWFRTQLFDRVFKRFNRTFGPDLHSGFVSFFYGNSPAIPEKIVESDSCVENQICVKGVCRGETPRRCLATYIENVNPLYDFTVFTAAIWALKGPLTSQQVTFFVESDLGNDIYVTVIYKDNAKVYSPYNVETVYYSANRNGYIGIDNICDNIFPESWITFPGLQPTDYECGFHSSDLGPGYSCVGEKDFQQLVSNPSSEEYQKNFLNLIEKRGIYKEKLETLLGENYRKEFIKFWFDSSKRFERNFHPNDATITSGYLVFKNWAGERNAVISNLKLGSQKCDKELNGFMEVEIAKNQVIRLFSQSNAMYDMVLFTEAFVRSGLKGGRSVIDLYTPNPRNSECYLTLRTDGGEGRTVRYEDYANSIKME